MDQKSKNALNLKFNEEGEYFILSRSDYYKNLKVGRFKLKKKCTFHETK